MDSAGTMAHLAADVVPLPARGFADIVNENHSRRLVLFALLPPTFELLWFISLCFVRRSDCLIKTIRSEGYFGMYRGKKG